MSRKHALISSIFILAMFITVLAIEGIVPFGDKTFLMFDLKRQYVDYYAYYKTILSGENNMFYSFSTTLGSGIIGFFSYYLTSPFLILTAVLKQSSMPLAITIIIGLKLMLAAFLMDMFLQFFVPEAESIPTLAGSVSWAFSGYLFALSMNLMWIDVVLLLPALIYCLEKLLTGNKKVPYILVLFLMIILNYYITYQILIFVAIWTIVRIVIKRYERPFALVLRVFFSTLEAGMLSAFLILPTGIELLNSPRDITQNVNAFTGQNIKVIDILSKLPALAFDNNEVFFGFPQVYCGVLLIFMLLMYFLSKEIPLRERIGMLFILAVFMISFCRDSLNLIWHAGMEPNGYQYREAFLCVFVMIICACSAMGRLREEITLRKTIVVCAIIAFTLYLIKNGNYSYISERTLMLNCCLILVFAAALLICVIVKKEENRFFNMLLAFMLIVNVGDLTLNAVYTYIQQAALAQTDSEYRQLVSENLQAVNAVKEMDDSFYRMENLSPREQNDSLQYSYNGVTHYSSAGLIYARFFLQRLGFNDDRLYTSYGHDNTAAADSILGVKYIITDGQYKTHPLYEKVKEGSREVFLNPFALSLAVGTDGFDISGIADQDNNFPDVRMPHVSAPDPFALQEDIYGRILGKEVSLFEEAEVTRSDMYEADGKYRYDFKVKTTLEGELYFYLNGFVNKAESLSLLMNGEFLSTYGNASSVKVLNLGEFKAGEEFDFTVESEKSDLEFGDALFLTENTDALRDAYREARSRLCEVKKLSSSHIAIDTKDHDGVVLTVPFQRGWTVRVDGKEITPVAIYDSLIYIPLDNGEGGHHIEMRFTTVGLKLGLLISLISLLILIKVMIDERKRQAE